MRKPTPKFIYFDLGNVLLFFSHELACENVAKLTGLTADTVRQVVFDSGLAWGYEDGTQSEEEFHQRFCDATARKPQLKEFIYAYSDIFTLNEPMVGLVQRLSDDGARLGILSNTSPGHWHLVTDGRYPFLCTEFFEVFGLSFELGCLKPKPEIYVKAAKLAGVDPHEIFFTDDRQDHVVAAQSAGFDAVQFVDYGQLMGELKSRSVA